MPISTNLKFTPYAWAKLLYWANAFEHEISGMGITTPADPMMVVDIAIIKQKSSLALTTFDPSAYADFVMDYCDPDGVHKMKPANCQRIWFHVHPEGIAGPSGTDEATFTEAFGNCDWAVMAILPKGGELYARLRMKVGAEQVNVPMKMSVAWHLPFKAGDHALWRAEVEKYVEVAAPCVYQAYRGTPIQGVRNLTLPISQKPVTTAPPVIPSNGPYPFNKDTAKIITNNKTAERKHLSKRDRRAARRKAAINEVNAELDGARSSGIVTKHVYAFIERNRVPKPNPEIIKRLEECGLQSTYMGDGSVLFQIELNGKWETVDYEDAYLHQEDLDAALEELCAVEHAIVFQTSAKGRKKDEKVYYENAAVKWEEISEHLYKLGAIEVEGTDSVYLTDTELEAINSVISGKLTADEALMCLPDYADAPTEVTPPPTPDSKLTEKAMELMLAGPEVLILESDN